MSEFLPLKEKLRQITSIDDEEWKHILPCIHTKSLRKGEYLVKENAICREIAFIIKGCMRYFYNHNGEEVSIAFFIENEFISAFPSFLTRKPSLQIIDAIEDTELIVIHHDQFHNLMKQYLNIEKVYRNIVENSLVDTQNRLAQYLLMKPEERYLRFMNDSPELLARIPQYYIASYLGITAVSLSRIRKRIFSNE